MMGNREGNTAQSRQAGFVRCCLKYFYDLKKRLHNLDGYAAFLYPGPHIKFLYEYRGLRGDYNLYCMKLLFFVNPKLV